jgi:hypothetical protein
MQHCIQSFVSKENAGKASVGVAALPGASACKRDWTGEESKDVGSDDRESYDTLSLARLMSCSSFQV